jgi:hypothetical protein
MAVLIEAVSVIIKAEIIESHYPGGWPAFEANPPNATLCADNELIRIGFMTDEDATNYVHDLARYGIVYLCDGKAVDLVIADQRCGFAATCDWAEFGRIDWNDDPNKKIAVCRKVGSACHQFLTPTDWDYEGSISQETTYLPTKQIPEFMDFIRIEGGIEVYRDLRTGKEVYVGRTSQRPLS